MSAYLSQQEKQNTDFPGFQLLVRCDTSLWSLVYDISLEKSPYTKNLKLHEVFYVLHIVVNVLLMWIFKIEVEGQVKQHIRSGVLECGWLLHEQHPRLTGSSPLLLLPHSTDVFQRWRRSLALN